ncbi:hypothetical protein ACFOHS_21905 [Jhaorihella thermophila]
MAGLWFEDFTPGMVIDHAITRTITETDNMLFCSMTYNPPAVAYRPPFRRTDRIRPAAGQLAVHAGGDDRDLGA